MAIAGRSASGAVAKATKIVFEEQATDSKLVAGAPQALDGGDSPPVVGKLPFSSLGKMKFQVEASGA